MILIADSGSTKTDWCLTDKGKIKARVFTQGINPFHQDSKEIQRIITEELLTGIDGTKVEKLFFYGAGCTSALIPDVKRLFGKLFSQSEINVEGDLLAAARAVCGRREGIACILGTGSNSCLYDGCHIVSNTPPLGYILGDEGSGAVLGKLFINAIFKGILSADIKEQYLTETKLTMDDIITKVYRQPLANRFLASTSVFINRHLDDERLRRLVVDNFRTFFRHNINQYNRHDLKIGAIGSIAYYFKNLLMEAAKSENYEIITIMQSPMDGLIQFHL